MIALTACSQQKGFSVKGTIKGLENQSIFLSSSAKPDGFKKIQLNANGAFEVRDTIDGNEPVLYDLVDASQGQFMRGGAAMGVRINFIAQNGDKLVINGTKAEYQWADISGNKYSKEFTDFNTAIKDLQIQVKKQWEQYGALVRKRNPANQPQQDSIADIAEGIEAKSREQILQFAQQHPSYMVSAIALSNLAYSMPADKTQAAFNALDKNVRDSKFAETVLEALGQKKASADTEIGKMAADFEKKDINGNTIRLSDFKGKYVLLDFWGSWCGACRASHPHLKQVYNQYKDQGLVVIGVAEERSDKKEAWYKAIQKDGLPWLQILNDDGKGKTDVVKLYGISGFPTKILIDKEGKIVLRTVGTGEGGGEVEGAEGGSTAGSANAGSATASGTGAATSSTAANAALAAGSASSALSASSTGSASTGATTRKSNIPTRKSPEEELETKLKEAFEK